MNRTVGIDLGVTSMSRVAIAEGATIISNSRVRSTPAALTKAIEAAANGETLNVVVESTAMAWFVAAVAAKRANVPHTLYRVAGHKAPWGLSSCLCMGPGHVSEVGVDSLGVSEG